MMHQLRAYFIGALMWAGLVTPTVHADETPVSYVLVGCVIVGVVAYKIHDYFNPTHLRLAQMEKDLATFKKETADNFGKVVSGQEVLTSGQDTLVRGQEQLQERVDAVKKEVGAVHIEVVDVRDTTKEILKDTTSLKVSASELQQRFDALDVHHKLQMKKLAELQVQGEQARRETRTQLDRIERSMVTQGDLPEISKELHAMIKKVVREEFERHKRPDYRALPDASDDKDRLLLSAPRQMVKQTACR